MMCGIGVEIVGVELMMAGGSMGDGDGDVMCDLFCVYMLLM